MSKPDWDSIINRIKGGRQVKPKPKEVPNDILKVSKIYTQARTEQRNTDGKQQLNKNKGWQP
jgi:hypothetical protein